MQIEYWDGGRFLFYPTDGLDRVDQFLVEVNDTSVKLAEKVLQRRLGPDDFDRELRKLLVESTRPVHAARNRPALETQLYCTSERDPIEIVPAAQPVLPS